MTKVSTTKTYHMSISNIALIRQIQEDGDVSCLEGYDGTVQEAIDEIRGDGRDWFTMGNCDNRADNGSCQGHKKESECNNEKY